MRINPAFALCAAAALQEGFARPRHCCCGGVLLYATGAAAHAQLAAQSHRRPGVHPYAGERRRPWVLVTYLGMAAALAAVASVGRIFIVAALACALAGVFIVGAQLILFALAPLYYRTAIRGSGVGASVAVGRLGSVVGPLFAGGLLAGGSGSAAVLLAIVPFVAVGGGGALALTWRKQCSE
jgi:MFS family permease